MDRPRSEIGNGYIAANPVTSGLARRPHAWPDSSAFDGFQHDGPLSGFLPG
jgi:hypothetical protein